MPEPPSPAPKTELAETLVGTTSPPADALPAVRATDRYALRDEIGRGGMGVVQLWTDPHIGRDVASKVLLVDAEEQRIRFLHEARTQGRLEHPAIVPVYDLASLPDGRPFFTMKRIHGVTLASILTVHAGREDEGGARFTQRKLLAALAQIALAIDFAHQRGFLHRDLKPANMMLGDFGEVYVLDWGIARRIGDPEDAPRPSLADLPSGLTADGSLLGTPGYMPPEQARGELDRLDARADVYALGCVLFEILTGEPLHTGRTTAAIVASTIGTPDRSPRSRAPGRDVPPELDALVLLATAPSPQDRLGSARELAERIERYLEGDRDVAQRATAAAAHAEEARRLTRSALGLEVGDAAEAEEARRAALREVGRALALRPDHPGALETLGTLLTEPPRVLPSEVVAELDAIQTAHVRVGGRTGAVGYGIATLIVLALVLVGRASVLASLPSLVLFATCATASFAFSLLRRPTVRHSMVMLVLSTVALASFSALFGPLLVVPMAMAINTMLFVVSNGRPLRAAIVATGTLGAILPLALEATGIIPPSYRFEDGALVLSTGAIPFDPLSLGALGVAFASCVAVGALALGPFRDDLDRAQREARVLSWQLRQFVPVGKQAAAASQPPAGT